MQQALRKKEELFTGEIQEGGGLSNEKELAKICPREFRKENPWSDYASGLFPGILLDDTILSAWSWKSEDEAESHHQLGLFAQLVGASCNLSKKNKKAVAGWMLSEMLHEVPE